MTEGSRRDRSVQPGSSTPSGRSVSVKGLTRLVRHAVSAGKAGLVIANGSAVTVHLGEERRCYPETVLRQAVSLGLVTRAAGLVQASAEARNFLRRALAAAGMEGEGGFAGQHGEIVRTAVEIDGARQNVSRNLDDTPLSSLARLKDKAGTPFFPSEALGAGEKLLDDFTRGQLQPRITSSWEPRLSSRGKGEAGGLADIAASALEARRRFGRAMEAMGPELSGVAADVCCFGKGLELVERERQWPVRSAKLMLRTALLVLARHYAPPPRHAQRRHRHHWGTEDFRPAADSYGSSGSS
ncbi:hypothetical protein D3C73_410790 [compost metagenome]